jgi:hypothetical protein
MFHVKHPLQASPSLPLIPLPAVKAPRGPKGTVTPGDGSAHDPEAGWSTRQEGSPRHYHFGDKAHLAVDAGSGLVRKALLTGAKTKRNCGGR